MANVYQLAREQRAALIEGDRAAAARLAGIYQRDVMPALERELAAINQRVDRLVARGEPIGPAVLYQRGRAENLLAEYEARLTRFLEAARARTAAQAREGMDLAMRGAPELLEAATPPGYSVDLAASTPANAEAAAGMGDAASRGLQRVTADQVETIRSELIDHVARGRHPRELARRLRDQAGLPLTRALTIARTEQLRAYRTGSHLTWTQPEVRPVLAGWVWLSTADSRTCAACWAMHGTLHPVDEVMGSHPNCRCTMVPRSKSWRELGFDSDDEPQMPARGLDLFRRLPARQQRRILGPGAYNAYRRGELTLDDLLGRTDHPVYGPGIRRRPLREARAGASRRPAAPAELLGRLLE